MASLIDFPDRFTCSERSALGSVDEIRWFTADRAGLVSEDVPPGAPLFIRGWLLHVDAHNAARAVVICVDGARNYQARVGTSRPDVANAIGNPGAEPSGFEAIVPTSLLSAGLHEISVFSVDWAARQFAELEQRHSFFLLPAERHLPPLPFGETQCEARVDEIRDESHSRDFDAAASVVDVARGALLSLRGWAFDAGAGLPASAVFGLVDGSTAFGAIYNVNRPDVAASFQIEALVPVGFALKVPTIELAVGRHTLEIVALAADGERLLRSACSVDLIVRERIGRALRVSETTPAFLDSVVRVASGTERERIAPMRAERGDQIFVRGWAIDGVSESVGSGVLIVVDDNLEISALYGLPRPDIAAAFANPKLASCGFTAQISTDTLSIGRHSARCYVIAGDGRGTLSTAQQFEFDVADSLADAFIRT